MNKKWFVYIVECSDNSLYTGITTDVDRRVYEHNNDNKKGARYTKARRPVSLKTYFEFENKKDAAKEEYRIKQLTRIEKLNIISTNEI
jgi:putative endonuclease